MVEESQSILCLQKSQQLENNKDLVPALEQARLALQYAEAEGHQETIIKAHARLGRLLMVLGHAGEALNHAELVLEFSQATPEAVDAMVVKATCLSQTNQLDKAEPFLQRAVDTSRFIQYKSGLSSALYNLSISIYIVRGKFSLALAAMEEAQQIDKELGIPHWGVPTVRGYIYQKTGERIRLRKALDEMVQVIKPGTWIAGIYYHLWSQLAMEDGDLIQAEEYLHLAMRIATQTGIPHLQVGTRIANSTFYRLRNESATAFSWAENAVSLARQAGNDHLLGQALIEMAQVEWLREDMGETEKNLTEAIQRLEKLRADFDLAVAGLLLTCLYREQDDPRLEQMWLRTARQMIHGGYTFILERERNRAYPLVAYFLHSKNPDAKTASDMLVKGIERLNPPPIKVKGLGQFSVWVGNRPIPDGAWNRRKSGELFRYLLLHKGYSASREEVMDELWEDNDPETVQDLLHQATSTIRRILEPDLPDKFPSRYLRVEGDRIFLRLPPGSYLDFEYFESQIQPTIQGGKPQALQRILGIYVGELFPMDQYSDWSLRKRTQLNEYHALGLLALCQMWLNVGEYMLVIQGVRQILAEDPWNEDAAFLGMQAFVRMGDKPKAVKLYQELESNLKQDLQLNPRLELRQYLQEIREEKAI